MIDAIILSAVRRGSENALGQLIDKYAAYVCVAIRNTVGENLTREDIEETASDVFFTLWQNAGKVEKLKSWLGAVARNKAKNKLREVRTDLPLNDEIMVDSISEIEDDILHFMSAFVAMLHNPLLSNCHNTFVLLASLANRN